MARLLIDGTEDVDGIVVGGLGRVWRYEFWTLPGQDYSGSPPRRITRGVTLERDNQDDDAIAWFKANFPREYAAKAEMRVFEIRG